MNTNNTNNTKGRAEIVKTAFGYAKIDGAKIVDVCRCAAKDGEGIAFSVGLVSIGKRARLSPLAEIVKSAVVDTWDEFNAFTVVDKNEKRIAQLCKKFAEREGLILGRNAEEILERADQSGAEKRTPKTEEERREDLIVALAKYMVSFKIEKPDDFLAQIMDDVRAEYAAQRREAEMKEIRKMEKMAGKTKKAK